jgi:hypothetical protein
MLVMRIALIVGWTMLPTQSAFVVHDRVACPLAGNV